MSTHRRQALRIVCALAAAVCLHSTAHAQRRTGFMAAPPRTATLPTQPKVTRYDVQRDRLVHQHSVLAPERETRPGGRLSYYGTRLTHFQFRGPTSRAGIYAALRARRERLDLKDENYQYRRQHYPGQLAY